MEVDLEIYARAMNRMRIRSLQNGQGVAKTLYRINDQRLYAEIRPGYEELSRVTVSGAEVAGFKGCGGEVARC